jgi:hypothetical protein
MTTVYISIGNSDDKLTQAEWAHFVSDVDGLINGYASTKHGRWFSLTDDPWQNACWCIEVSEKAQMFLRDALANSARAYGQDSIAWAVADTSFIRPAA